MQLTPRALVPAILAVLALAAPVLAGVDEQDGGLRFEYFADSDDIQVTTAGADYEMALEGDADVAVRWTREVVVIPAISAPPGSQEAVDAISGASRPISSSSDPYADFRKARNQVDTSVRWRTLSGGYYVSDEDDYFAQKVSGGYGRNLLDGNLRLDLGTSWGWDEIQPFADDTGAAADRKTTFHWSAVATQVATPVTVVQGGVESSLVRGLQHNPYRMVWVAGAYETELHPDSRSRWDAFVKVNQYLAGKSSLSASYMLYGDDWGIGSHTIGAKLHQYVGRDVVVRYRYRFYTQSAADFFREDYTQPGGVDGRQTADYRMGEFDSHLFGTNLVWNLGSGPLAIPALNGIRASLKYERYFNSNNFSANIFESGLTLSF